MLIFGEFARRRSTQNRYLVDSDAFWRPEYHPRVRDLQPMLLQQIQNQINAYITNGTWTFPVEEQNVGQETVYKQLLLNVTSDYLNMVNLRRCSRRPDLVDNITLQDVINEWQYSYTMALWDLFSQMLITNNPLNFDDFRIRSGQTGADDKRKTKHDISSTAKLDTTGVASHDIKSVAGTETKSEAGHAYSSDVEAGSSNVTSHTNALGSSLQGTHQANTNLDERLETGTTNTVGDTFLSPQDQGVKPFETKEVKNEWTDDLLVENDVDGANSVQYEADADFSTQQQRQATGSTGKQVGAGQSTSDTSQNAINRTDTLGAGTQNTSKTGATQDHDSKSTNVGSLESTQGVNSQSTQVAGTQSTQGVQAEGEQGSFMERGEVLNMMNALNEYSRLNSQRLMLELDNRLTHLYLEGGYSHSSQDIDFGERAGGVRY